MLRRHERPILPCRGRPTTETFPCRRGTATPFRLLTALGFPGLARPFLEAGVGVVQDWKTKNFLAAKLIIIEAIVLVKMAAQVGRFTSETRRGPAIWLMANAARLTPVK
jgi:hypothetical protein